MWSSYQEEIEEQTTKWRCSNRFRMNQSRSNPDNKPTDMEKAIDDAVKYSLKILHCTKREGKQEEWEHPTKLRHWVYACVVCDAVIKGTESISHMTKKMEKQESCLGVDSYRNYHSTLYAELERQSWVKGLEKMLLLPRLRGDNPTGLAVYSCWFGAMRPAMETQTKPPKFVISNGFATGQFPEHSMYVAPYETENNWQQHNMTFMIFSESCLHLFDPLGESLNIQEVLTNQLWVTINLLRWIHHSCVLQWTWMK